MTEVKVDRAPYNGLKWQASAAFTGTEAKAIYNDLMALQPLPVRLKSHITQAAASFIDAVRGRATPRDKDYRASISYCEDLGGHTIHASAPAHNAQGHRQNISLEAARKGLVISTNMSIGSYNSALREVANEAAADNTKREGGAVVEKYAGVMTDVKTAYETAPKFVAPGQ
jgi:hypothetical protein